MAEKIAMELANHLGPIVWLCDMMSDFLSDSTARNLQLSREELMDAGINANEILNCRSWLELAEVPGFATWFHRAAVANEQAWRERRAVIRALVHDHVKAWWVRIYLRYYFSRLTRALSIEAKRFEYYASTENRGLAET